MLGFLWIGLFFGLDQMPARIGLSNFGLPISFVLTAAILAFITASIQLPIDLIAMRVERRFGQIKNASLIQEAYVQRVIEGVLGTAFAGLVLGVIVLVLPSYWYLAAGIVLAGIGVVHIAIPFLPARRAVSVDQAWTASLEAEVRKLKLEMPKIVWIDHGERSLAGGWQGVGMWRRLAIASSLGEVEPRSAALLIAREIGHDVHRHQLKSACISVAWIIAGVLITALFLPDRVMRDNPAGLVIWLAAVMSTWSWLGLFCLPSIGRRQIFQADAFAAHAVGDETRSLEMLAALSKHNLPDEKLPPVVAWVFHPIPTMEKRRAAVEALFTNKRKEN